MDYLSCNWDNAKFLIISANVFGSFVYYSHLLPLIFSVIIGFFILLKDKKSLINQALFFILAVFSFWVYADLVLWASEKPELIMVFWALEVLIEPLIYAGCLYFFWLFLGAIWFKVLPQIGHWVNMASSVLRYLLLSLPILSLNLTHLMLKCLALRR